MSRLNVAMSKMSAARWAVYSRLMAVVWLRRATSVGERTRTYFKPNIENRGRLVIGSGVRLNSNWAPLELVTGPLGEIVIGDGAYLNYGTIVSAQQRVSIGANVMIGNYGVIADTEIPGIGLLDEQAIGTARPIEIGDGAWLAARVTILPGVRIGDRAVIAAGSIVAGNIPPDAVAGGIPARVLRHTRSAGSEAPAP